MNQIRIDQVSRAQTRSVEQQQELLRQNHKPLDLFSGHGFERVRTIQVDTQRVDIPSFTPDQQQQLADIASRIPQGSRATINQAINDLTEKIYDAAPGYVPGQTLDSGLTQAYDETFQVYMTHSGHDQRDAATREFMFVAMAGFENDISEFGLMVQEKTEQSRQTREEIAELQEMLSDWPEEPSDLTEEFTYTEVVFNEDGTISTRPVTENITKAEAENLLNELENTRMSLREMTEMQTFDLQSMAESWQQALQLISAIFEDQHKTRTAMINNAKA